MIHGTICRDGRDQSMLMGGSSISIFGCLQYLPLDGDIGQTTPLMPYKTLNSFRLVSYFSEFSTRMTTRITRCLFHKLQQACTCCPSSRSVRLSSRRWSEGLLSMACSTLNYSRGLVVAAGDGGGGGGELEDEEEEGKCEEEQEEKEKWIQCS
ncbi:hypothetical protein OUZ56_017644 [Daphnia magna]|uniref:Uncharacterized protein n=1 Tax=Daphnia magna TaxID=35525 RepID=A0ABR0ATD0_9CRUS|nr:hypothetical protein OUZ56_017644 [Daphnia magna]